MSTPMMAHQIAPLLLDLLRDAADYPATETLGKASTSINNYPIVCYHDTRVEGRAPTVTYTVNGHILLPNAIIQAIAGRTLEPRPSQSQTH